MNNSEPFGTYTLIDSGNFEKLEQLGPWHIVRPSLQAVWKPNKDASLWGKKDAWFVRESSGYGKWSYTKKRLPDEWAINLDNLKFKIKLTNFGHIGIFPEHISIMQWVTKQISECGHKPEILNLFAYTGAASLASASAGAEVTHVDAAKGVVDWARDNAELSGLKDAKIRWIVDDVQKFIKKEISRKKTYDGIILDPPSFGRGPKNELWKIEDHMTDFLDNLAKLFSSRFNFILFTCHTPGYTAVALENLLREICPGSGIFESGEMMINEKSSGRPLPSGTFARWNAFNHR